MFDIQVGDRFCHHGEGILDYLDLCWSGSDEVTIEWDGFGHKSIKATAYSESDEILDEIVIGIKEIDRDTWEVVSVDRMLELYR